MRILRIIFGILYVLAGIAKAFPQLESVEQVLSRAYAANQGSLLAGPSQWLLAQADMITIIVGVGMVLSGLCYLLNRFILLAASAQILMLGCFMTILHRAYWQIFPIDAVFLVVALLMIRHTLSQEHFPHRTFASDTTAR